MMSVAGSMTGVPVTPMLFGISAQPISVRRKGGVSCLDATRVPFFASWIRTLFMLEAVITISVPPMVYTSGFAYQFSRLLGIVCNQRMPKLDDPTTLGSILWFGK